MILTKEQENRLHDALEVLVESAPSGFDLQLPPPAPRRRPILAGALVFAAVLAVFIPVGYLINRDRPAASDVTIPTITTSPGETTVVSDEAPIFGDIEVLSPSFGDVWRLVSADDVLYAAGTGPTDRVFRSTDHGLKWEPILEADPGDAEGLVAGGDVVALVINDDNPARDTIEPHSVVTGAPRVLIFDPSTGDQTETLLPRPEDPEMTGLPLDDRPIDQNGTGCALGGYQSWIIAGTVAVGDRIVVGGAQQLVGELADGTVICDGQTYRSVVWTSDDKGQTFQLHDSVPLASITWTGNRFLAWSNTRSPSAAPSLVTSADGITWSTAATTPPTPDAAFVSGTSIETHDNVVVAFAGVLGWTTEVPDNVTDPEQLRDILNIGSDVDIQQTLDMLGVDLPLDEAEKLTIVKFNGQNQPIAAFLSTSTDGGATWESSYVPEPITAATNVGGTFVAMTSSYGDPTDPSDESSSLLVSDDGQTWTHAIDLPGFSYGPNVFTQAGNTIYVGSQGQGTLWKIPVGN